MNEKIRSLQPAALWGCFADICAIPHPSHHEEAIRKHMLDFAARNGIECAEDSAHNVIMRIPATPGMENRKGIILQAHVDMVPQANSDRNFDFLKDPIQTLIDGEWVTADGTTLGADNGIGAAAAMAVLTDKTLRHGPVEALFTATEEAGMEGAFGLKAGLLKGDILINLDSEREGELCIGCAGGLDANIALPYLEEPAPAGFKAFRIEIKGLKGGHSGIEIILERANANKLLVRVLTAAERELGLRLASIDGGGLRNAIPREAMAVVAVPQANAAAFEKMIAQFEKTVAEEYKGVEDAVSIRACQAEMPATLFDHDGQAALLRSVYACPNGVMRMSKSMHGLVQTSTNLARVVSDKGIVKMQCLMRSASNSEKADLGEMIRAAFELAGAKVELSGGYGGWNPNTGSPVLHAMTAAYEKLFGVKPAVEAVHAGLECAIIGTTYPELDMISMGPTIKYPHSPDEKVNIASVQKFWDFLCHALENAPEK